MLWLGRSDVQVTWEPSSSLPAAAIREFEEGIRSEAVEERTSQYGLETTTIVVGETGCESPQHSKKPRTDRPVVECSSG